MTNRGPNRGQTLDHYVDTYTVERVAIGSTTSATARQQRRTLTQFSTSFGWRPLANMGEADVLRWMATTSELLPSSRRTKLSIVKNFCRWLVRRGHLRKDPSADVRSPRQPRTVPKTVQSEAVGLLLETCPDARARLVVLLMVQEGLRCAEVAGLELGDINGQLVIIHGKGGHQRMVPLVTEVRSALDTYLSERGGHAGPLIQSYHRRGDGLRPATVGALVRRMCELAGIKQYAGDGISAHGLRRTCASDLAERDVGLLDIAAALGHKSIETTQRHYTRHRAGRLAGVMEGRWYGRQRVGKTG